MVVANDSGHNFGKYCGEETGRNIFVTGGYVELKFHTDNNKRSKGFAILFTPSPLAGKYHHG